MQTTGTVWTTLIEDHPGIIPVKFGQEMLFKEIVDARTDARTDGRTPDIEGSQKLTWALRAQVS